MQITRNGRELRHGDTVILVCATPLLAQWLEAVLDAVARLDGIESGARDERAETIAMIQAVMALRALKKEARQS
jgi:hypothetical protein